MLSAKTLDNLHPLLPEVMQRQATINLGHVAHGKSTLVKAISGVQTVRFKNELERNITIKLGYANAKIYKCDSSECPEPDCYRSYKSDKEATPPCPRTGCTGTLQLIRHVSFVDCPGHDILMATMLNGAAVMDAAMLLVAANESCPQPQTAEHLAAIEIMRLNHIIVLQNKIDLVKESVAEDHYEAIKRFSAGTLAEDAPIIPISGQLKYNMEAVCEAIANYIPVPNRDFRAPPKMIIIRSFDVNKPGADIDDLKGGVAGGSILCGVLQVGDEIEVRPGLMPKDSLGRVKCIPIYSRIVSLYAENNDLPFAIPGGLIGVGTLIDPDRCRADRLVGQVLGHRGKLPSIYSELEIQHFLLRRLLGVRTEGEKSNKNEILMINVGSRNTGGRVLSTKKDTTRILLSIPACTEIGEKIALSRRIGNHWSGVVIEPSEE